MNKHIAVLAGDGIGPEIISTTVRVLQALNEPGLNLSFTEALVGGAAYAKRGHPLPEDTLQLVHRADAVLFGAVGDPQYDHIPRPLRPEQAILGLRKAMKLFANLRPAKVMDSLLEASSIRPEILRGTDMLILRELLGDIYFGEPRSLETNGDDPEAINTMRYKKSEITRIAKLAFHFAGLRRKKLCSIDKANVLEVGELWRNTLTDMGKSNPDIALSHLYVDNAAMQLLRAPTQFDVIVCGNLFGDILSDEAAMLTGSIGLLPSASLNEAHQGLYEPIHGSAPDIAGKDVANPIATVLSAAMMMRYSFNCPSAANRLERAVDQVIARGFRTRDISQADSTVVGCKQMGDEIIKAL
jgi:3-isopropylmalate dehydrogenase